MTIAIASDHAGFAYKENVKGLLTRLGFTYKDFGADSAVSCDYPDYAHAAASSVSSGETACGIIICGTGIGVSIVANKHRNVRAASCESTAAAEFARKHNDINILCFGERLTTWETAETMIKIFLSTEFEGGRHSRRVEKIHELTGC